MPTVLIVDDAYVGQVLEMLGVRGGRVVPARAVDAGAAAPTWAQVLVAGADSGTTSPRVSDGMQLRFSLGATEDGFIRALGGTWLLQARSTSDVGDNASNLEVNAGQAARANGGNLALRAGNGGPPGVSGGNVKILAGNSFGGTNGIIQLINGAGTVVETIADGGVAWGAGVPALSPAVVGARGGNAALASLLTTLAGMGLITDTTTP